MELPGAIKLIYTCGECNTGPTKMKDWARVIPEKYKKEQKDNPGMCQQYGLWICPYAVCARNFTSKSLAERLLLVPLYNRTGELVEFTKHYLGEIDFETECYFSLMKSAVLVQENVEQIVKSFSWARTHCLTPSTS